MRRILSLSLLYALSAGCVDGVMGVATSDAGSDGEGDSAPDVALDVALDAARDANPADAERDVRLYPAGTPPLCPSIAATTVPTELGLDPFYTRYVDSGGIPIVGSDSVPDEAFAQAHYVVASMLRNRPCHRAALVDSGIRIGILARDEVTTDLPEYRDFYDAFPGTDWDTRGRGFGATLIRPLTSGSVDNLLQDTTDPWFGENIMLHEFAHSFWEYGVVSVEGGRAYDGRLDKAYDDAMEAGLWADTYAATNASEYWAEGVQSWFGTNIERDPPDGIHNSVNTRDELEEYDPGLAALIAELFDPTPWAPYCVTAGTGDGPEWNDPTPIASMPVACSLEIQTLHDQGCGALPDTTSPTGALGAELVFVNRRYDETFTFSWVDFDGSPVVYGTVPPRSLRHQSTFVGNAWVVTDDSGSCVGLYEADAPRGRIFLD